MVIWIEFASQWTYFIKKSSPLASFSTEETAFSKKTAISPDLANMGADDK
jgi:hypothetical protein